MIKKLCLIMIILISAAGYPNDNLQSTIISKPGINFTKSMGLSSAFEATAEQHRNAISKIDGYNGNIGVSLNKKIADYHSVMLLPKLRWQDNHTETQTTRLNEIYYKVSGSMLRSQNIYNFFSNYEMLYIQDLGEYTSNDYWGNFVFLTSFNKPFTDIFSLYSILKYELKARKKSQDYLTRDYYAFLIIPSFALGKKVQFSNAFRFESLNSVGGTHYQGIHLVPAISYQATSRVRFNLETTLIPYNGNSQTSISYNQKWAKTNVYNLLMVVELF
ncbi:MAG: hypothetical protein A2381_14835 [Bdellovibrionales bacterium RIFOXYB1_FULL_37_110]|nr:MAG: hypothetical protein A2417_10340 [Bdellovibrionales bacterium RIFOXYC1_FULL_37_79]OFZ60141.1 MAG: hypothetical protein A2381_14835 [Bdellovibrionales bacterium RIFOXYB1_FULL_37_110]OFZ64365.1 MAG: hypothetical protein A2577_09935 [Bdellovibrionales bacterium RIFOXYD1_FULL_36_51]